VVKLSDTRNYCLDILYLINDAIVLIVDTRLRLPTEILVKVMQQEQGASGEQNVLVRELFWTPL